jgi:hypothetical protein
MNAQTIIDTCNNKSLPQAYKGEIKVFYNNTMAKLIINKIKEELR